MENCNGNLKERNRVNMDIESNIINEVCEHPKLKRNMVWCRTCGRSLKIDNKECMRNGYPKCCGYTMTIDSPEERKGVEQGK